MRILVARSAILRSRDYHEDIHIDQAKIETIMKWEVPKNPTEI